MFRIAKQAPFASYIFTTSFDNDRTCDISCVWLWKLKVKLLHQMNMVLAFGLTLVVNVVEELRNFRNKNKGAYNVDGVLEVMVMVGGLEKEL